MTSLWTKTAQLPEFPPLAGDTKTDVLVIGGGIAGILCLWSLRQAGVDALLVESGRICGGVTGNTTAKLTAQHGLIYHRLVREFDLDTAQRYLQANLEALERYQALCRSIDCDFQEKDAFVYSLHDRAKLVEEVDALRKLGYPAALCSTIPLPFPVAGAVKFPKQGQFHPLKFLGALAQGLPIHEHTKVLEFLPGGVVTDRGIISARNIIVATHFPFLNKHGSYFLKQYQHRSYVLALEHAPDVGGMYVDEDEKGLSFRNQNGLLLLGGGSHRTGKQGGSWQELSEFAQKYFPNANEVARWATQDCMTLDGIPYIGQYSRRTPHLYVATGFQKWGMTTAMVAAGILTDLIRGKKDPYARVFSPSRSMLRPQLAANAASAALHLLTPTKPRCPHLGCALKYNPQEHSWDCPCHGSRFSETGDLLDNPATDGKKM